MNDIPKPPPGISLMSTDEYLRRDRPSSFATVVSVPRSLAERTEAMFRSVDPDGAIAQEWKRALATPSETASIPRRSLQAMRWAADIFGWSARDQQERAMRFAEEAAELAHAAGLKHDVFEAIVDRVYNRPPGDVHVEVGQALLTLEMLGEVLGVVADQAATREFNRVQAIPKEEWERRHQAKVDMGIAK
jgi:hypothetical protein